MKNNRLRLLWKVLAEARYVPAVLWGVKNGARFLWEYARLSSTPGVTYALRNGARIRTRNNEDVSTLMYVFFMKDYGKVPPGSVVVDVGANVGIFSVYAAVTSPGTRVYAYEPMADNFALLQENLRRNDLEPVVRAFNLGLAARDEERTLYLGSHVSHSLYAVGDEQDAVTIKCVRLESVFEQNGLDHIDILKVDCEGAEYEILYNAPDACFERIKQIRLEYHRRPEPDANPEALGAFLRKKGYTVTWSRTINPWCGMLWLAR